MGSTHVVDHDDRALAQQWIRPDELSFPVDSNTALATSAMTETTGEGAIVRNGDSHNGVLLRLVVQEVERLARVDRAGSGRRHSHARQSKKAGSQRDERRDHLEGGNRK